MASFLFSLFCHSMIFYHEADVKKTSTEHKDRSILVKHFYFSLLQPLFPCSPTPMAQFTLLSPFWHLCYQLKLISQALIWNSQSLMVIPKISDLIENYRNTIRKSKTGFTRLWTHFASQLQIKILYNWWDKKENVFLQQYRDHFLLFMLLTDSQDVEMLETTNLVVSSPTIFLFWCFSLLSTATEHKTFITQVSSLGHISIHLWEKEIHRLNCSSA